MAKTVQARLDTESQEALETLMRQLGITRSEVIRESLRRMGRMHRPGEPLKLIGAGMFDSGVDDLATNPRYMETFGMTRAQREEYEQSQEANEAHPPRQQRNRRSA